VVSRHDGALTLRRESAVDPELLVWAERIGEQYDDVFRRLAE